MLLLATLLLSAPLSAQDLTPPEMPDLAVVLINRQPPSASWHGWVESQDGLPALRPDAPQLDSPWPRSGAEVTWSALISNEGFANSPPVRCVWKLNNDTVLEEPVPSLAPLETRTSTWSWIWEDGNHQLTVEIVFDSASAIDYIKANNKLTIATKSLPLVVYIPAGAKEVFRRNLNVAGSFSIYHWLHAHLARFNECLAESRYPSAPNGCLDRISLDRIFYYATDAELEKLIREHNPFTQLNLVLGRAGQLESLSPRAWDSTIPGLLCRTLGLADSEHRTVRSRDNRISAEGGYPLYREYIPMPLIIGNPAGAFRLSEYGVHALNRQHGRPRGFSGDHFFDMAPLYAIVVRDRVNQPVPGARVRAYQRDTAIGIVREPVFTAFSDNEGRLLLPNRPAPDWKTPGGFRLTPNPFGKLDTLGASGVMLLEIRARGQTDYAWMDIADLNLSLWVIHAKNPQAAIPEALDIPIKSDIPVAEAPTPPARFLGWRVAPARLEFQWLPSLSQGVELYRVFSYRDRPGPGASIYTTIKEVKSDQTSVGDIMYPNEDTWYALTAVDAGGRDSPYSNQVFMPACLLLTGIATTPEGEAFLTDTGTNRIHRIDSYGRFNLFHLHPLPGEELKIASVLWSPLNELIVINALRDRLEFYDNKGGFLRSIGETGTNPGQLRNPADMTLNAKGQIAVADQGNRRIVLFDQQGNYLERFGEGVLNRPIALDFAPDGSLHVLDAERNQCIVFYEGQKSKFFMKRTYGDLRGPSDVLVDRRGVCYISDPEQRAILIFDSAGTLVQAERPSPFGSFDQSDPRGLALDPSGRVIYVDRAASYIRRLDFNPIPSTNK